MSQSEATPVRTSSVERARGDVAVQYDVVAQATLNHLCRFGMAHTEAVDASRDVAEEVLQAVRAGKPNCAESVMALILAVVRRQSRVN
jgi:hypothetical protein